MSAASFGSISKAGESSWRCRWTDSRGCRRSANVKGTRKDAEAFLAAERVRAYGADGSESYARYWARVVEPQIASLEDKTRFEYVRLWERELKPHIGSMRVSSTRYAAVQSVIDGIESPSVQRAVARLWRKVCNMAIRDGLLQANPVQMVVYKPSKRKQKAILPAGEVLRYIDAAQGFRWAHLAVLEMCAGLRHEEACAIVQDDVRKADFGATVSITKARVLSNGRMVEKSTKNEVSMRRVPIAGHAADVLLSCGIEPPRPDAASKMWRAYCEANSMVYVPFGNMRSNFATHAGECCEGGLVDVYMGHAGASTMDRWYRTSTEAGLLKVASAHAQYIEQSANAMFS